MKDVVTEALSKILLKTTNAVLARRYHYIHVSDRNCAWRKKRTNDVLVNRRPIIEILVQRVMSKRAQERKRKTSMGRGFFQWIPLFVPTL